MLFILLKLAFENTSLWVCEASQTFHPFSSCKKKSSTDQYQRFVSGIALKIPTHSVDLFNLDLVLKK